MKVFNRSYTLVILGIFLAILAACPRIGAEAKRQRIVLKGARLIDGTGGAAIENSGLVIEGDHLVAAGTAGTVSIPKDADVRDVSGKTIMPALINLHGHLGLSSNGADSVAGHYTEDNVVKQLNKYLSYGVGTVASLGQDEDTIYKIRDAQRSGNVGGARLFTAGRGFLQDSWRANPPPPPLPPPQSRQAPQHVQGHCGPHPPLFWNWGG